MVVFLVGKNQVSIYPSGKDGKREDMIVDTWPRRGIRESDNQVGLGKQPNRTRLPLAMSPTAQWLTEYSRREDYELKVRVTPRLSYRDRP
jgi:hypothetical protein